MATGLTSLSITMGLNMKLKMRHIFILLLSLFLLLSYLFPARGEGINEHVYTYGIVFQFLTIYSREFMELHGSAALFNFSFNLMQFIINVLLIWLISLFVYNLIIRIKFFSKDNNDQNA